MLFKIVFLYFYTQNPPPASCLQEGIDCGSAPTELTFIQEVSSFYNI